MLLIGQRSLGNAQSVFSNPDISMNEPRGRRGGSRRGVQRLGDELEQRPAGPLDFLARLEAVHGVKLLEGDAGLQRAVGPGQRSEAFRTGS